MQQIPKEQVSRRIKTENTWWQSPNTIPDAYLGLRKRAYFDLLFPLINTCEPNRAVLLLGPRRVGKTVLLHHVIQELMTGGINPCNICYISVDHPIFNGLDLHSLLELYSEASNTKLSEPRLYIIFDEIQYLKDWEIHLKILVDRFRNIKFIASGSSAAALKLKSLESGAGRFTDFLLPPLTFHEYLDLLDRSDLVKVVSDNNSFPQAINIAELNKYFLDYLNYGGYPEVIFSKTIQADPGRFIKSDIIDRVLLRDLPSLYGIQDIQELNYLFTTLAYNTANEVSLENLSKSSGVAKNTIKKYIEYLEAAFLIKLVHRIDRNARHFQRANFFKVYLTNPSMWSALFEVVRSEDPSIGSLAETAIFSQWFHHTKPRYYARWNNGEVDIVGLSPLQKAAWAIEVKWSDRFVKNPYELKSLFNFCRTNGIKEAVVTTLSKQEEFLFDDLKIEFIPTSLYCWTVGRNLVQAQSNF